MEYNNEVYNLLRYAEKLGPEDTFYSPVQFILKNLHSIASMSIYDLANASFVSTASISRMCRELGYKNYQEFRISLYSAYRHAAMIAESNRAFLAPREDTASPDTAMALNYLDQCRAGLDFSESFVRSDSFGKHLRLMREASSIFVFSTTYQDVIPLQNKLILSGKYLAMYHGSVPEVVDRSRSDLENVTSFCCVFLLHTQEEYNAFKGFIQSLKANGASIIMLRPKSIVPEPDYPLLDLSISFPDVGSLSDETFFSSYIACLTIPL